MAAALWLAKEVAVKKGTRGEKKEPWWKRKIESDITKLRKDIKRLERKDEEKLQGKRRERLRNEW